MSPRRVHDSLGGRMVPDGARYGAHTSRSLENFAAFGCTIPEDILRGILYLKIAAARANARLGTLDRRKAAAIEKAARGLLRDGFGSDFAVSRYQAGSGTSSHMNVNEVLAFLASQASGASVHPNDDVNRGQSTNDIFPSGGKIALVLAADGLQKALSSLAGAFDAKAKEFAKVLKCGRTHLQDAVPVSLGQEFRAYGTAVRDAARALAAATDGLRTLAAGGNAVGTGINAPRAFRKTLIDELNRLGVGKYRAAADGLAATQFLQGFAFFTAGLRGAASTVGQIANNLRLLSSGPCTGLGEIRLPPVEAGSSIMPGKINPSICEAVNQACFHVCGLDAAVAGAAGAGQLELNTHMPQIASDALEATKLLAAAAETLEEKCVKGIEADEAVCRKHLEGSAALATLLSPALGYEKTAALVKEALAKGQTLREIGLAKGLFTEKEYARLLATSTAPNG